MPARINVIGKKFGRSMVIAEAPRAKYGRRNVSCICDCGRVFIAEPRSLRSGKTSSCGCLQRYRAAEACRSRASHGMAKSPEYNSWIKLRSRCNNTSDRKYPEYGGRGIFVCKSWNESFKSFIRDMGRRPFPNASVDRIDVNGPYSPKNCRWAGPETQARNKRNHRLVNYEGTTMPLSQACEMASVNYRSALYRLNAGKHWMPTTPPPEID